jgi:hypothetical protein
MDMNDRGEYKQCNICGVYGFESLHTCPAVWTVRVGGSNDNWLTVYAINGESAAQKFCREGGFTAILHGPKDLVVEVRPHSDERTPVRYYSVSAESQPVYHAYRLYVTPPTKGEIWDKAKEFYLAKYPTGTWELTDLKDVWIQKAWEYFFSGAATN